MVSHYPQGNEPESRYGRQLQAARETFPEFDIIDGLSGLIAVPKGTEVLTAMNVDRLVEKLRERAGQETS
jgi:hypothetical protein